MKIRFFQTRLIYIMLLLVISGCDQNGNKTDNESSKDKPGIFCDAESVSQDGNILIATNGNDTLFGGKFRTDSLSHSGKFSVKLINANQFSMVYHMTNLTPGKKFNVSVWRFSPEKKGALIVSAENSKEYYHLAEKASDTENGWELITTQIKVPGNLSSDLLKIYVWNPSGTEAFFDDLSIEPVPDKKYPEYEGENINLIIGEDAMAILEKGRNAGFKKGLLEKNNKKWLDAFVVVNGDTMSAELRLKGDWLDHLQGKKWSFRIKLSDGNAWRNMLTFSIHTPVARDYLSEWVAHQIFENEDVLTPRYGFIPVKLNGVSLGLYAYEEHFEKQMVEAKKRREGPVFKFDETAFWNIAKIRIATKMDYFHYPVFEASEILAFKMKRTLKSENLSRQFNAGRTLVHQYKFRERPVSEIFDVEKIAKYYAVLDMTKFHHGLDWHNQRFYYNPVLCKLEPVAFDGYTETGPSEWSKRAIYGDVKYLESPNKDLLLHQAFKDTAFLRMYIHYLHKYSDPKFLEGVMENIDKELKLYEEMLREENPEYKYDLGFLQTNIAEIKKKLPEYEAYIKSNKKYPQMSLKTLYNAKTDTLPYARSVLKPCVQAYHQGTNANKKYIRIYNYYVEDIFIAGTGKSKGSIDNPLNQTLKLKAYNYINESFVDIETDTGTTHVFYNIPEDEKILKLKIKKYPAPENETPQQELIKNSMSAKSKYFELDNNNRIVFKKGIQTVREPIVIPKGYEVVFEAGAELDFIEEALFISYSPLFMTGSPDSKISITSSDKSALGFTVLQAEKRSNLEYVNFEGFNTLIYKEWILTGAVNFYESDVTLKSVNFSNNVSEDALNIIRSDFEAVNCGFKSIFSDAFDSDFCTGRLDKCTFENVKNDAIDFSTSVIAIDNCKMNMIGDKAVSGGENSNLKISNIEISDANIGFASKDLSVVEITSSKISKCKLGVAVYVKKPEYGPAKMTLTGLEMNNIEKLHLIEEKSELIIDGERISGSVNNVVDLLY